MTTNLSMTTYILIALAVACWAALAWAIWKWAPDEKTWTVWCPVHKKEAKINVIQRAVAVVPPCAGLTAYDIMRCSLFKGREVNCRKECLDRA
jgi:hypothetical protein